MSRIRSGIGVVLCLGLISIAPAHADWELEDFAGGGPHLLPALESNLDRPTSVARDGSGTLYVLTGERSSIHRITPAGVLEIAFVPGTDDRLDDLVTWPSDLEVDASGRLLLAGYGSIARVDMSSGEVTEIETDAQGLSIAAGSDGTTFVLTSDYSRAERQVYRVDWTTEELELVAGATCSGWPTPACWASFEDGMLGTDFALPYAADLQIAEDGDVYIGLSGALRLDAADGRLYRVAGGGPTGFGGDGGPAVGASFAGYSYLAFDPTGNLLVGDSGNHRIRRVDAVTGLIDTIVGDGTAGFSGDGGSALLAQLNLPAGLVLDQDGSIWIADTLNMRVRRFDPITGFLETTAGNGSATFSGDGYPANRASITRRELALDAAGNAYIPDMYNHRVRKVDAETGLITTFAGTGEETSGVEDDGMPAAEVVLPYPVYVAVDPDGNVFVSLRDGRLRRIDAATGLVSTVPGYYSSVTFDNEGRLYTRSGWAQLARVDMESGDRTPVAGNGSWGYNGDGIPALEASLDVIGAFRFGPNGDLYLTCNRGLVRRVDAATGLVHTIAGGESSSLASGGIPQTVPAIGTYLDPWLLTVSGSTAMVGPFEGTGVARIDELTGRLHWHLGVGPYDSRYPPDFPEVSVRATSLEADDGGNLYLGWRDRILLARNVNRAPVPSAGGDRSISCESNRGGRVVLNGSASSDLDDQPGADPEIIEFWWFEDFGLPTQRRIATGSIVEVTLPIGTHDITLQVGDRWGSRATDTIAVDVFDDLDPDGDGLGSCIDNCPELSNVDQTDDDGNGLGDACDPCLGGTSDDGDGDGVCADTDNCPTVPNPQQLDRDLDTVGDACDICPDIMNPDQTEYGSCQEPARVGECLAIGVDMRGEGHRGRVLLSHAERILPTALGFQAEYRTDNPITMDLYLNDVSLGTWEPAITTSWQCASSWFYVLDPELIASVWKPGEENKFRIVQSGEGYVAKVAVGLLADIGTEWVTLYGSSISSCGSWLPTDFDHTRVIEDPFYQWEEMQVFPFGPDPLSASVDLEGFPDGDYRMCIAATNADNPGTLHVANRYGELYKIDFITAEPTLVGALPAAAASLAHDAESGTSLLSNGFRTIQSFDVRDAVGLAPPVSTEWTYGELEFLPSGLFGAVTWEYSPPSQFWTTLYRVNATEGTSESVGHMDDEAIYGLAYDATDDELLALTGYLGSSPIDLTLVDRDTAELTLVGPTGHALTGLVTGPDGLLYALDRYRDAQLYRIDPDTALVTPIGETGLSWLKDSMLGGRQGSIDCIEFAKQGETLLKINDSCSPLVAIIAPVVDTECTSTAGGVVLLDGTASTGAGTGAADLTYEWFEDYGTTTERFLGSGAILEAVLSLGSHHITLRVANGIGEAATASITVSVFDGTPPTLTLMVTPETLWPPNHRMVDVTVAIDAQDNCGTPAVQLIEATSSEPDDAPSGGDGHTTGDIEAAEIGTPDTSIALRAERAGSGDGRVYTLVYEAVDTAGHSTQATTRILVPHSQNGASEPLRLSVETTGAGTLVRWNDVPGAMHYHVIRGQLDALHLSGEAVDLGAVECVESGSLDNMTAGLEDATVPAAGRAFFYLAEYHDGWQATSYGTESAARPRIADSGVCLQD
jgi:WD40 repeat protein